MPNYLTNTANVLKSATRQYRNRNGFTINLLKRYEGNDTIKTQAVKCMSDGSYIEQICMDYGNGSIATFTQRNNVKKPFWSIVFKQKGKVVNRCIQNGDSFVYENTRRELDAEKRLVKKHFLCRKNKDGSAVQMLNGHIISKKLDDFGIQYLINEMLRHFRSLG